MSPRRFGWFAASVLVVLSAVIAARPATTTANDPPAVQNVQVNQVAANAIRCRGMVGQHDALAPRFEAFDQKRFEAQYQRVYMNDVGSDFVLPNRKYLPAQSRLKVITFSKPFGTPSSFCLANYAGQTLLCTDGSLVGR